MDKGKIKCEMLKGIRAYVARKYGLEYTSTECTHQGDCSGTCPKCDAELADIQRQLEEHGITDIAQDKVLSDLVESYVNTICQDDNGQTPLEGDAKPSKDYFVLEGLPTWHGNMEGNPIPSIVPQPEYERRVILECPVAGVGFHDIEEIWDDLYVGTELALVRERKNKHDKNAVAVVLADEYDGDPDDFDFDFILGYIPRKDNTAIAAMLDMGWQDQLEAEITELKDHAPYNDKLHIAVYIRSKEPVQPKDDRLRVKIFKDDEWEVFTDELWEKGVSFFRWGGFPPWELDLPEKGDKVVFIRKGEKETVVYLMMVIAMDDDCEPFVDDIERLHMVDDCSPYVLSVVKGPLSFKNEELFFLEALHTDRWQPDIKLEREVSDKLLKILV